MFTEAIEWITSPEVLKALQAGFFEWLGKILPHLILVGGVSAVGFLVFNWLRSLSMSTHVLFWDRHDPDAKLEIERIRNGDVGELLVASAKAKQVISEVLDRYRPPLSRRLMLLVLRIIILPWGIIHVIRRILFRGRAAEQVGTLEFTLPQWQVVREALKARIQPMLGKEIFLFANGVKYPKETQYVVLRFSSSKALGKLELQLVIMPAWFAEQIQTQSDSWLQVEAHSCDELSSLASEISDGAAKRPNANDLNTPFAVGHFKAIIPISGDTPQACESPEAAESAVS